MKKYATFLIVFSILHNISYQGSTSSFTRILKEIFHDKIICYINDNNSMNYILEKALLDTQFNIITISYDYLEDLTTTISCTGYIVALSDATDFSEYYLKQKNHTFMFKPWTTLLLMYEKPLHSFKKYEPILNSAMHVLLIELKQPHCSNFFHINEGIVIKSVFKNATFVSWHSDESKIDWTKFRRMNWTPPKEGLKVALFDCPPFIYINIEGMVEEGVEYRVIKEVIHPVPIRTVLVDSEAWGLVLNSVEQNVNDVGACSQWFMNSKDRDIDFSYPIRQIKLTFLVKKPTLLPDSTFIFQPLHSLVYLVTIFMLLLVLFGFALARNAYKVHRNVNISPDLVLQTLYLVRVLSMGGIANLPLVLCRSVKFLLGLWYLYCLILSTYYSAGLTSSLTNPRYTNNIDTLKQMVDSKIQWFAWDTSLRDHFLSLDIPIFTALAKLYVRKRRIRERSETSAIAVKVLGDRFVTDIDKLPDKDKKYYKTLTDSVGTYYMGFVLQKNSPWTKLFDEKIFRLIESGIYDSWWTQMLYKNHKLQRGFFTNYVEDPHMNISIKKIQGAFYLLAIGYLLSLISFLVEFKMGNGKPHRI